jgi:hypothetical protein
MLLLREVRPGLCGEHLPLMVHTVKLARLNGQIYVEDSKVTLVLPARAFSGGEGISGELVLGRVSTANDRYAMMPVVNVSCQRVIHYAFADRLYFLSPAILRDHVAS